jgi:hydroxyacylglutathione hydrolase
MFIKQLYTGCLSEAAYYIESNGEAAIIDPLRDIEVYLEMAKERKATITKIFETHFHADFVSGHIDLAKATGAPIIYGPQTDASFKVHVANDGEEFKVGDITIKVLHTPGHTMESTCYLLKDELGKDHCVFTGDTLFVGDVGRPDLAQQGNTTMQDLAGLLYESIHSKLFPLADDVIVYPAHGAGSSCGKNLGPNTFSTIGEEKESNYAMKSPSKEAFVKEVTAGIAAPPAYFPINAKINKEGYASLDGVLEKGLKPLSVEELKDLIQKEEDLVILDTRNARVFTEAFIPGAVSIGLEDRFAEWAGNLLPFDKPIVLVTDDGKEKESVVRLARVGFENVCGYLRGGFESWKNAGEAIDMIIDVEADELLIDLKHDEKAVVLDVRKTSEFAAGHLPDAINLPVQVMHDPGTMAMIEDEQNLYVHCGGGYRSVIAASLLKRQGLHNLRNVLGGWGKIKKEENVKIVKEPAVASPS